MVLICLTPPAAAWAADAPAVDQGGQAGQGGLDLFEKKIRPVLNDECFRCHSASAQKLKGSLMLDSREAMLKGGDSGAAIEPGSPDTSLLIKAIRRTDPDLQMPPKKSLDDDVVAAFVQWVQLGAPWPVLDGKSVIPSNPSSQYDRLRHELWSWQPILAVDPPAVKDAGWCKSDLDHFVYATLQTKGLIPSAPADRLTLLRRVTFDLTGLPPTPAEVDAFTKDQSPQAFEKVVDRLLASKRFGERWGRHWLDVARYAESSGMARNVVYPYAWRYRDYVIDAFNRDEPYNRFLIEQLAGDLLPADNPHAKDRQTIATGFLCIGPRDFNERSLRQFQMNSVDEQIDTVGKALLATTIACARCHDHKFDPIPTSEYYSLAAIFLSSHELNGVPRALKQRYDFYDESLLAKLSGYAPPAAAAQPAPQSVQEAGQAARDEYRKLFQAYRADGYAFSRPVNGIRPVAMAEHDNLLPTDTHVLVHGELDHPTDLVHRGFLSIPAIKSPPTIGPHESGRLELARWITDADNPLTSRVMANRIWEHLFGVGLVSSVDNFGSSGEKPINPQLLDYLARRFMDDGWSIKSMIRTIVLSSTYQQASTFSRYKFEIDPDNHFLWRQNQRRLEAEAIRDAILTAAGRIDLNPPKGSLAVDLPSVPLGLGGGGGGRGVLQVTDLVAASNRRSIYMPLFRDEIPSALEVFDMADPNVVDGARDVTTVAPQALYMLNDPFVVGQSKLMVQRLVDGQVANDSARIDLAYKLALGRPASSAEQDHAQDFIDSTLRDARRRGQDQRTAELSAWSGFCQALFASAEFRYLN